VRESSGPGAKTQPSAQRFKYTVVVARAAPAHSTEAATPIAIRIRMRGSLAAAARTQARDTAGAGANRVCTDGPACTGRSAARHARKPPTTSPARR
jgi:hypothetical protein